MNNILTSLLMTLLLFTAFGFLYASAEASSALPPFAVAAEDDEGEDDFGDPPSD